MFAEIQVLSGHQAGQLTSVDASPFFIGSGDVCQLKLGSASVSHQHCFLKKDLYSIRIRDNGSRSGTFVNGKRIFTETYLKNGDEISLGDVPIRVVKLSAVMKLASPPAMQKYCGSNDKVSVRVSEFSS